MGSSLGRRLPTPLKRRLVPLWNAGHRLAWWAGDYARSLAAGEVGRCACCGGVGPWRVRRRVIPPELVRRWGLNPAQAKALARKESGDCPWCGAKLRARRLAEVLLSLYPVGHPPAPARSLAAWSRTADARDLHVAEINRIEGLHDALAPLPHLAFSDFLDGEAPGAVVGGVRHEDLTALTYPDAAFDLVLTSETLEHVPDPDRALAEIRRVLRPGGRHLFTIPRLPGVSRTFARRSIGPGGRPVDHATPICHPGGDVGYPVFTEFGADLGRILVDAGFAEIREHFGPPTDADLAQAWSTRRPR
jgi:SAM-dependent methyltransferase